MGASEGRKDRPCAVVVALPHDDGGDRRVVVVPVTHSSPTASEAALELPSAVKASLRLDSQRSWICLDELNVFAWPGYDLRPVPETGRYEYGVLPEALFRQVRDGIVALPAETAALPNPSNLTRVMPAEGWVTDPRWQLTPSPVRHAPDATAGEDARWRKLSAAERHGASRCWAAA